MMTLVTCESFLGLWKNEKDIVNLKALKKVHLNNRVFCDGDGLETSSLYFSIVLFISLCVSIFFELKFYVKESINPHIICY